MRIAVRADDAGHMRQVRNLRERRRHLGTCRRVGERASGCVEDDLVGVACLRGEVVLEESGRALRVRVGQGQVVDEVVLEAARYRERADQ